MNIHFAKQKMIGLTGLAVFKPKVRLKNRSVPMQRLSFFSAFWDF
jgi:hypothetical protein